MVVASDEGGGADAKVLEDIVHYASGELRTVVMAKMILGVSATSFEKNVIIERISCVIILTVAKSVTFGCLPS